MTTCTPARVPLRWRVVVVMLALAQVIAFVLFMAVAIVVTLSIRAFTLAHGSVRRRSHLQARRLPMTAPAPHLHGIAQAAPRLGATSQPGRRTANDQLWADE